MRSLLLLCLLLFSSCKERTAPPPDRAAHLKQLRQCRPELESALVERLMANPPDAVIKGLTPAQRPALAEQIYQALYEGFFLGGPSRDFAAYLATSPARPCFGEKDCGGFSRCVSEAVAGATYAGIEALDLPPAELPAAEPTAEPTADATPAQPDPGAAAVLPPDPPLSKEGFDLSKPSGRTDWAIPWDPAAPRLWFSDPGRLRLVAPEGGKLKLVRAIPLPASSGAGADAAVPEVHVTRHGAVLVRTPRTLLLVDRDGGLHAVWKTAEAGKKIGALTLWDDRVVMAAEGSLIVLDASFRELGRVSLGLGAGKDGHDVLMHGDEALILDNHAVPYFLFRVDLKDPRAPQILDDVEDHAASAHLLHQWTDEKAGLWVALRSTYGSAGNHQMLLAMDLKKPAARVKHELPPGPPRFIGGHPSVLHHLDTFSERFDAPPRPPKADPRLRQTPMAWSKRRGVRFHAGSSLPPAWLLASDDRGLHLGRFVVRPPKAEFEIGRTVVVFPGAVKRRGRVRLDEETAAEEDPFGDASMYCVMDQREQAVVVVLTDKVLLLSVAGGRIRPVADLANPLDPPIRVRIHR